MRAIVLLLLFPVLALAAPLSPAARQGRDVVQKAQCNRCHAVSGEHGLPPAARERHCVDCHTWILGTKGDAKAIAEQRTAFPDWERYLENIVHFTRLPDLGTLTRRVQPAFVRGFLDAPFDLRPHLDEAMIPVRLTAAEKDAVVAYLAELAGDAVAKPAPPVEAPAPDRVAAGRAAFVARGCPNCHLFGDTKLNPGIDAKFYAAMRPVAALAPNLRFVRERIPRDVLVRFIVDPRAVDPHSAMPSQGVPPEDASRIADFLLHADAEAGTAAAPAPAFAPLDRKVTYDEVNDEVLGRICVHCHMDPASNDGDGGAGNTGGLGFAGVGLNLETPEGIKRGLVRDGKRVDVLKAAAGRPPLLLEALLRRHREAARDFRPAFADLRDRGPATPSDRPGMPLGLPPLSERQMRLVVTWLAQGAPGL